MAHPPAAGFHTAELQDAWVEGEPGARWRSSSGLGPSSWSSRGGVALVSRDAPHEVRNDGEAVLRFVAVYASADVTTRYEQPVRPGGERERRPAS